MRGRKRQTLSCAWCGVDVDHPKFNVKGDIFCCKSHRAKNLRARRRAGREYIREEAKRFWASASDGEGATGGE